MGEQNVKDRLDTMELQAFSGRLLDDLQAFATMLDRGMIEQNVRRIGAEQELFIVDANGSPAMRATELLEALDHPDFTTELARFNVEFNLPPRELGGDCLSLMEADIHARLDRAREVSAAMGCDLVMVGILPTLDKSHLGIDAMTPMPRYYQLNNTLRRMRGGNFTAHIKGLDELRIDHDNILFEACNTSFQVHFQVGADEFARLYNLAQVVTAPVLAVAANSPLLMHHRLWRETRVALFQESIDNRTMQQSTRGHRPRVSFGHKWVNESVTEIFREDIARYRILLSTEPDEDPMAVVDRGEAPKLSALRLHNGTVYRWNRPCYGINDDGQAHLRIENRVLPSGPTPADEIANAAFFFGLMVAVGEEYGDVRQRMAFDAAKDNFLNAARYGLKASFSWLDGKDYKARDLITEQLLPRAREGLRDKGIAADDIHRYLGLIDQRVRTGQTGAQWMLSSLTAMGDQGTRDERQRALVVATLDRQKSGLPVHAWRPAALDETKDWRDSYRHVGQYMTTDLFTVRPEDIVDLAASVMDWEHIRHVPVEDEDGLLVGVLTMRDMLKLLARRRAANNGQAISVAEIMHRDAPTVTAETLSVDALRLMRDNRVSCLPVVDADGRLQGLVTDTDLVRVATAWMEEQLASISHEKSSQS